MKHPLWAALAVQAAAMAASPAQAGSIIQDQRFGASQILFASPVGQIFTAEDAHILSIGFWIDDFNPQHAPSDHEVDIRLYQGVGTAGALLGGGTYSSIPNGYEGWVDIAFPDVTLVPGALYTALIADDTVRWGVAYAGDLYAGGSSFFSGRPFSPLDLTFRVLAPEAAVPEPGSLGLALLGALGTAGALRLRRRKPLRA